jgi:hypothetical protein
MFDLMPFWLQMKFDAYYRGQGAPAERFSRKDNILLRPKEPLECSFGPTRCGGKTTTASKASLP